MKTYTALKIFSKKKNALSAIGRVWICNIRKVPYSNICRDTQDPGSSYGQIGQYYLKFCHNSFHLHIFQFIIEYYPIIRRHAIVVADKHRLQKLT
jgi:hypothetical protein